MQNTIASLKFQLNGAINKREIAGYELEAVRAAIAAGKADVRTPSHIIAEQSFWDGQIAAFEAAIATVSRLESN